MITNKLRYGEALSGPLMEGFRHLLKRLLIRHGGSGLSTCCCNLCKELRAKVAAAHDESQR
eukprot:6230306-Amphidinium_carterae.1